MAKEKQMQMQIQNSLVSAFQRQEKCDEAIKNAKKLIEEWDALGLKEQMDRRSSLLFDIAILSLEDRKLCVAHLVKKGIIDKKTALIKVNEIAEQFNFDGTEENKKERLPDDFINSFTTVIPAQDFKNNVAYVAVPIKQFIDGFFTDVTYLVTSDHEKFRLCNDELLKRRILIDRETSPQPRWSYKSIEEFLQGRNDVNIVEVFGEIDRAYRYYVDFGEKPWSKVIALWNIGTYFLRLFGSFPYIHLNGDLESGKTKILTLTSVLAFNGQLTFNSTPAYITRVIHNNSATCCVDEAERLKQSKDQDNQLAIGMFNGGYKKGSFCGKVEQTGRDGKFITREFEAYSAKMFASIRGLEPSLKSRCIPIIMVRTSNKEILNLEVDNIDPNLIKATRDKLYLLLMKYHLNVKLVYQCLKDNEILGREWELWKPIFAIAKLIDSQSNGSQDLYAEIRQLALQTQAVRKQINTEENLTPKLLLHIFNYVKENLRPDGIYSVNSLVQSLVNSNEEDFAWLGEEKNKSSRGKWLGNALRNAGIVDGAAKAQKDENNKTIKVYQIELERIRQRLRSFDLEIDQEQEPLSGGTTVTTVTR